jgi:hypothetical protein
MYSWNPYLPTLTLTGAKVMDVFLNKALIQIFLESNLLYISFVFEMWWVLQRITLTYCRPTETIGNACICSASYCVLTNLSTQSSFCEILIVVSITGIRVPHSCEMSQFVTLISVWHFLLTCPVCFWLVISPKLIPASYL